MKIKTLGWLISPCIALAACTETALDYRSAEGTGVIAPEWGAFAYPATAYYRFYADDGEAVAGYGTDAAASAGYFSTTLPVGSYHLLAYNTDAHGVAFTGLESRNAAEVRLVSEMQPGNVYSWNVDDVDVPLQGTVQYTPVPRPLVKQMLLHFQVTGMEEAKVLNGKLNGVYPSVLLHSGKPSEQSISAAPETNTSFTVTLTRAETRNTEPAYMASAEIRLLGLLSPEYGAAYDSRLHLQVRNSGGEMYSASVNMNGTLTDIIRLYAGELPADETVEVELGINLLNAVLTAEVKGWTEGSGEGGVGDYKRKVFYDKRERIMYE